MFKGLFSKKKKKSPSTPTRSPHSSTGSSSVNDEKSALMKEELEKQKLIYNRLKEYDSFDMNKYQFLFKEKECCEDRNAEKEIDILLKEDVSSYFSKPEVVEFERRMKDVEKFNNEQHSKSEIQNFVGVNETILPCYFINEEEQRLVYSQKQNLKFVCGVHIDKCRQFQSPIFQAISCDIFKTADDFLKEIIQRANNIRAKQTAEITPCDWVLKVTGSKEYIYGQIELFKFEAIRRCLKYGKPYVELNMLQKDKQIEKFLFQQQRKEYVYPLATELSTQENAQSESIFNSFHKLESLKRIHLMDLKGHPVRVKVKELICCGEEEENVDLLDCDLFVKMKIVHGFYKLGSSKSFTIPKRQRKNWNQTLFFRSPNNDVLKMNELTREAVLCLTIYKKNDLYAIQQADNNGNNEKKEESDEKKDKKDEKKDKKEEKDEKDDQKEESELQQKKHIPLGSFSCSLMDFQGKWKGGIHTLKLNWNQKANLWSFGEGDGSLLLTIQLDEYALPLFHNTYNTNTKATPNSPLLLWETIQSYQFSIIKGNALQKQIDEMLRMTPLQELTPKQKWICWKSRDELVQYPELLPFFLSSIPYHVPEAVEIAKDYVRNRWKPYPSPLSYLELLDFTFASTFVRELAVQKLNTLRDDQLMHFVLQFVQALKFELYHDTPLCRFLLSRANRNEDIGQSFFWYLKSELHVPALKERFGLLLKEFLTHCGGAFRWVLLKQTCVVEQLYKVSLHIKKLNEKGGIKKQQLNETLRTLLHQIRLPPGNFRLPLSSKVEVSSFEIDKCRVMTSAKLPLFLFFRNADPFSKDLYGILFKVGDDLRQDLLTLQMLRIMDEFWKESGLDLHIRAYSCMTTGDFQGMIEIVQRSETIADITVDKGITKIMSSKPLLIWLQKQNAKSDYEDMKINFMKSCAGYCVATYVLGIGDRHNDNIMLSKNGDLFHIDFGHFLGHKKKFLGMNRETTPFVFTNMYAEVLGGSAAPMFKEFEELVTQAFNIIRKKTNLIIVLLLLMLGCGIPELQTTKDISWIQTANKVDLDDEKAKKEMVQLIKNALKNKRQFISDTVHILRHKL